MGRGHATTKAGVKAARKRPAKAAKGHKKVKGTMKRTHTMAVVTKEGADFVNRANTKKGGKQRRKIVKHDAPTPTKVAGKTNSGDTTPTRAKPALSKTRTMAAVVNEGEAIVSRMNKKKGGNKRREIVKHDAPSPTKVDSQPKAESPTKLKPEKKTPSKTAKKHVKVKPKLGKTKTMAETLDAAKSFLGTKKKRTRRGRGKK